MNDEMMFRRRRYGLSQKKLAEKAGIDQSRLIGIEYGRIEPTLDEKFRIAGILNMRIDDLFGKAKR
jgi:putative transcriptional regulator